MSTLKSGNVCYHSVQNLLSSSLLLKIWKLRYTEIQFCLLLCVCVNLGHSHWGRNVGWGCVRIGCWGEYLVPKRDLVTPEFRKLHNEEFNDLYSSPDIFRVIKPTSSYAWNILRIIQNINLNLFVSGSIHFSFF
jgi:hypothetical protein